MNKLELYNDGNVFIVDFKCMQAIKKSHFRDSPDVVFNLRRTMGLTYGLPESACMRWYMMPTTKDVTSGWYPVPSQELLEAAYSNYIASLVLEA